MVLNSIVEESKEEDFEEDIEFAECDEFGWEDVSVDQK